MEVIAVTLNERIRVFLGLKDQPATQQRKVEWLLCVLNRVRLVLPIIVSPLKGNFTLIILRLHELKL